MPATIALHDGKVKIGLTDVNLEALAQAGQRVRKVSRRDFAAVLSSGAWMGNDGCGNHDGGTSRRHQGVCNRRHWGVHRGAENDFDISADLTELAQTNVAVVCAAPKVF